MEINPRRKNSSGDKFSFPIHMLIQDQDQDQDADQFEFGCVSTPGTPSSPADHLFFNGKLLPHAFPSQPTTAASSAYTRSSSRTSSVSSKDSLMSSRSNSRSSSSSTTSARTSTSTTEASEQRRAILMNQGKSAIDQRAMTPDKCQASVLVRTYSSSRRWQFIAPAPVLSHQVLHRKKARTVGSGRTKKAEDGTGSSSWFGWRFFRWVVAACNECHAIKPATGGGMLQGNAESSQ